MRALVQRVKSASASVDGKVTGSIGSGYLILFGVHKNDSIIEAKELAIKISKLRVMADSNLKMNKTLSEVKAQALVVSQFTLYSDSSKGSRPSFVEAARSDYARELYNIFIAKIIETGVSVETGSFGEYMKINCILDGPVTILLEI